jgi:hypothetical protein
VTPISSTASARKAARDAAASALIPLIRSDAHPRHADRGDAGGTNVPLASDPRCHHQPPHRQQVGGGRHWPIGQTADPR